MAEFVRNMGLVWDVELFRAAWWEGEWCWRVGKELKGYMVGGDRSDMLRVMPCTSLIVRIRLFCGFVIVKVG